MILIKLLILGLVIGAAGAAIITRTPQFLRRLAIVFLFVAGLYGVFGLSLLHRLAWYTPERARYVAYSDAEKDRFSEGASAAQQQAGRFLPLLAASLVVLAIVAFRRS